jgi:N-acetylglutamate synthase-like GNAT family acetyltransferase
VTDPAPELRPAAAADADAIRDLVAAAYGGYATLIGRTPMPMLVDYAIAVREHEVWVLDAEGEIVGVLELILKPGQLWIENVAIAPAWQGRGLGRLLLRHADDEARHGGVERLGLLTNERYLDNIAMYERYGYRETHRQPHLGTDLVFFEKQLAPG